VITAFTQQISVRSRNRHWETCKHRADDLSIFCEFFSCLSGLFLEKFFQGLSFFSSGVTRFWISVGAKVCIATNSKRAANKMSREHISVAVTLTGCLSSVATLGVLTLPIFAHGPFKSNQFVLVAILAFFNFIEALTFAVGPAPIPAPGERPSPLCVAQGSIMQFCSISSFLWILFFCKTLASSIRASEDVLSKPAKMKSILSALAATCAVALASCIYLGVAGVYGDASFWCWVDSSDHAIYLYYLPLVVIWAFALAALILVGSDILRRIRHAERELNHQTRASVNTSFSIRIERGGVARQAGAKLTRSVTALKSYAQRRASAHRQKSGQAKLKSMRSTTVRQLASYILVFIAFSTFGLVNRLRRLITGQPSPDWLVLLQAWTMPLQGLANAVVFGMWLKSRLRPRYCSKLYAALHLTRAHSNAAAIGTDELAFTGLAPEVTRDEISLFAATWNVGEAQPPATEALASWLPQGRAVYLIGLQECLDTRAWAKALGAALGSGYVCVLERKIGSTATGLGYHGYIALLAFESQATVDGARWYPVESGTGAIVKRGKVGAGKASVQTSNKGAVGAAFRA
jgi:hypothetical protein